LEDRPLKLYQQLQQAGENPMFVMKPNKQLGQQQVPAIIPPVPPLLPVPTAVEEKRPVPSRRKKVRTTIIGGVPSSLPNGRQVDEHSATSSGSANAHSQNVNANMNSAQPARPLNRHRQHGSIS
jgi:hypothetical protein